MKGRGTSKSMVREPPKSITHFMTFTTSLTVSFRYDDRIAVGPSGGSSDPPVSPAGARDREPLGQAAIISSSSAPSDASSIIGRCTLCNLPWDDYSARERCGMCRILLLVCPGCHEQRRKAKTCGGQGHDGREGAAQGGGRGCQVGTDLTEGHSDRFSSGSPHSAELRCMLCLDRVIRQRQSGHHGQRGGASKAGAAGGTMGPEGGKRQKGARVVRLSGGGCASIVDSSPAPEASEAPADPPPLVGVGSRRRIRILCLHGFRQTGSRFMVRFMVVQYCPELA